MGKRHGVGRLECADGTVYVGEWSNDFPRGKGFFICESDEKYKGEFYLGDFYDGLK